MREMSLRRLVMLVSLGLAITCVYGCGMSALTLNYSPSSILTAQGSMAVGDFKYLPALNGVVESNVIRNTALGTIRCDQNIDVFLRDAVFKELRFVGIRMDNKGRTLTGEIQEFLIDDLGYSVDWTLRVQYLIKGLQGEVLYTGQKNTQKKTAKFGNFFGTLNEIIKLNVDELIKDQGFIKVIN